LDNKDKSIRPSKDNEYSKLITEIGGIFTSGKQKAYSQVNSTLVETYWKIGKRIVEFEQAGNEKAEYGTELLDKLSHDLFRIYGKGFSRRNLLDMRRFFVYYPIWRTVSAKLSWSHYNALLSIQDNLERLFYEKLGIKDNLSVRELERQINTSLYERLILSKSEANTKVLKEIKNNNFNSDVIVKDPYVFEFLGFPDSGPSSEKDLEQSIVDNLQMFILEMGKGFSFISRQYRISLGTNHFYIDLVFYHRILKCFILIDLKLDKVGYADIGQMNLYLNYFKKEENQQDDNLPIGIVLTAKKNEVEAEYALGGISNNLFIAKYEMYLPKKEVLEDKIREIIENS